MGDGAVEERPTPGSRWAALGAVSALTLETVELLVVDLPFVRPVETALGTHHHRPVVLVHLNARCPDGALFDGWGECAALADTTYDPEDAGTSFAVLEDDLLPALVAEADRSGVLPSVGSLPEVIDHRRRPLAYAALEMAVADAHLRAERRSFAGLLGVESHRVTPGSVTGLPHSVDELVTECNRLRSAGFVRVKIKVAPGFESIVAEGARSMAGTGLRLQVDANGAYGSDAAERLAVLDDAGLLCIEQPLGRDDLEAHRRLAEVLATPLCLDESLHSPASVVDAVERRACSVVCVKPARLGGIGSALEVIAWCAERGVPWWIGGMFESGYARGANRALSALSDPSGLTGGSLPGDLAPTSAYLARDLVPQVDGSIDAASGDLHIPLPGGPGIGPPVDTARPGVRVVRETRVQVGRP